MIPAELFSLLQIGVVGVVTNVLSSVITHSARVTLANKTLMKQIKVKIGNQCVVDVKCLIDALVPGLGASLVWDTEVGNVFASLLEIEDSTAFVDSEIYDYMVLGAVLELSNFIVNPVESIITVFNGHSDDLIVH